VFQHPGRTNGIQATDFSATLGNTFKIELRAAVFPSIALNTLVVSTATQAIDLQVSLLA